MANFVGTAGPDTLTGGGQDDQIYGAAGDDVLRGGFGNDFVRGGSVDFGDTNAGSNQLFGEEGDDWLYGGAGPDTLDGGNGGDVLQGSGGGDVLRAGAGDDHINAFLGDVSLEAGDGIDWISIAPLQAGEAQRLQVIDLGAGQDFAEVNSAFSLRLIIEGGDGVDSLELDSALPNGTAGARYVVHLDQDTPGNVLIGHSVEIVEGRLDAADIHGSDAAETITGSRVDDLVIGGGGADQINGDFYYNGSEGTDTARGGADSLYGGAGDDSITDFAGSNFIRGDAGNDRLQGGRDFDDINGNMGDDTLSGGRGDDWVVGGKDNDSQSGDAGGDVVWGNLGNDTLDGGDGADQVRGGQGDDIVSGGAGDDFVSGDRGNDTIAGGAGADLFHGSQDAGIDRVIDFRQAEGDRVMLDPGTTYTLAQAGADTVIDMGGGHQMILVGVQHAGLGQGWLFQG
jgi:Ca2+-binding RTX toxin-like protein